MKSLLKDLVPGDEFEYVNTAPGYRKGRFLVLNTIGSYLRPCATKDCRFLYSFAAKKVVNHFVKQEIIMKKFANEENNMKNSMGHFEGWKFGVPVRVYERNPGGRNYPEYEEARLINEDSEKFIILFDDSVLGMRSKQNFHYELIPHKYNYPGGANEPRYLICKSPEYTAFCNSLNEMVHLETLVTKRYKFVPTSSTATLNIDGKTIELSAETTAELKKKLGV